MKRHVSRQHYIARLALTLCVICALGSLVHAQQMNTYIVIFPSVGLAPGQTLRLTLFNPNRVPLEAQARVHHSSGVLVGLADGSVKGGTFHSFDFNYSDIHLMGEERTGRLQLNESIYIRMAQPWSKTEGLTFSIETIEISDGTSNTIFFAEKLIRTSIGVNKTITVGANQTEHVMGIVPGETLRITVLNPKQLGLDYFRSRVKTFDANGNLIKQSDELTIPSGESRSFDFNRDELPFPGETGTDRIQMRIEPTISLFTRTSQTQVLTDVISFEVLDNSNGKTTTLSGQDCLIFFLGGHFSFSEGNQLNNWSPTRNLETSSEKKK